MKKLVILVLGFFMSCNATALNKEKISDHLMKALNLDASFKIEVGESKPSKIKGLKEVEIRINNTPRIIFMSKDEKFYIWGDSFDLSIDPDQARAEKIDLKNAHAQGDEDAPVAIVEYTDMQCPYCQKAHSAIKKDLYKVYKPEQVRWVFKHFPLANHKWAFPAAVATECAGQQDAQKFWSMSENFFEHAKELTPQNVRSKAVAYAKKLKLNVAQFETCLDNPDIVKRVEENKSEGIHVGVTSTPTLFINGRMRRGFRSFKDLQAIIDEKLKE